LKFPSLEGAPIFHNSIVSPCGFNASRKEFGLNNRKSLYSLQPKPPFLQIDRPLTSDGIRYWRQKQIYRFPFLVSG
jgi:hypothetical protein